MAIIIEATYEDGVLKPSEPLPLQEHEKVRITVEPHAVRTARAVIPCSDAELIDRIALDKELEYEQ